MSIKKQFILRTSRCRSWFLLKAVFLCVLCFVSTVCFGQNPDEIKISSIIVDENGETVIGANVMIKGTTKGTTTDLDGKFSMAAPKNGMIEITYIGYQAQQIRVDKVPIKIQLIQISKALEELVVIGYGAQTKKSLVGAIAQVKGESVKSRGVFTNMTDALSGIMPGVTVLTSTGIPGGSDVEYDGPGGNNESQILIRGKSSWNGTAPLFLVDGIERKMNDIDINEIESVSVLKDASATAVYGVKGANGVILITSKRGQLGKPQISVEVNYSLKSISKLTTPLDSYQGLLARNYAIVAETPIYGDTYWYSRYTPERILNYYKDQAYPEQYTNTNWLKYLTKDFAPSSKFTLTASGGSDFVKYFVNMGFTYDGDLFNTNIKNLEGIKPEMYYKRFNFRSNLDFNLTKTTQFRFNLSGYYGQQQANGGNGISSSTVFRSLYNQAPNAPLPIYSDGIYGDTNPEIPTGDNPFIVMMQSGIDKYNRTAINTDFELKQDLGFVTKGLSLKGKLAFDNLFRSQGRNVNQSWQYNVRKYYNTLTQEWVFNVPSRMDGYDFVTDPPAYTNEFQDANDLSQAQRNLYYEVGLNYSKYFGKHNIGAMVLWSRQDYLIGSNWPNKREDWVGRLTYDYLGRYLVETNGAYNGSAKFGPKYRFDFFPSLALGWRISEERLLKNHFKQIDNLKLRFSIGLIGSDNVNASSFPYMTSYNAPPNNYRLSSFGKGVVNTQYNQPYVEGAVGNPDLHWETARKIDVGLDFGFLKMFTGTADYFNEYRYNMLIPGNEQAIPFYYTQSLPPANLGSVRSNGFEVEINFQKKVGDVNLRASYNWTIAQNKVINKDDPQLKPEYQKRAGYAIGQLNQKIVQGIQTSYDDLYTGVQPQSDAEKAKLLPGDYRFIDFNSDGVINTDDSEPFAYPTYPINTYGFSIGAEYKRISINLQFYGMYNVSLGYSDFTEFKYGGAVIYQNLIDRSATPEYGVANPTWRQYVYMRTTDAGGSATTFDASFLRLKSAEISYSFPSKLIQKLSLDNARVYINGNNLLYFSKLPIDIEGNNVNFNNYPTMKAVSMGLKLTF
ncbi:MAG: TonB-dependent receptor [Prolixibacteraceae bacterium]|nr:TonB-dependent receptor [Prolixibacteraceae bacterium]